MMAVGEETGAVDTMLDKVAQFYNNEVTATVDALTSLIEPLLIAVIGGAVGRGRHRPVHADVQHHQPDQVVRTIRSKRGVGRATLAAACAVKRPG